MTNILCLYILISCIFIIIIIYTSKTILTSNITTKNLITKTIPKNLSSRDEIGMLLENEKLESGIEVGVQIGIYANTLLGKWNSCKTYVMIDPWLQQKNYDDGSNVGNELQNQRFISSMNVVNKYSNRVEFIVLKTTSEKALPYLNGKLFDFIYLDGRHDYMSVKSDIEWYYPLLKPGGIFAGHDYQDENGKEWKLDRNGNKIGNKAVKSAVDEFAEKYNLNIVTTNEYNWKSWMIRKPENL